MDLELIIAEQIAFSLKTFGPGKRRGMIVDHIQKELIEVEIETDRFKRSREFVDVALLAIDGIWREVWPWKSGTSILTIAPGIADIIMTAIINARPLDDAIVDLRASDEADYITPIYGVIAGAAIIEIASMSYWGAAMDALAAKLKANKARTWPDWRTADPDKAIEHIKEVAA